jgi:hypothetical protein
MDETEHWSSEIQRGKVKKGPLATPLFLSPYPLSHMVSKQFFDPSTIPWCQSLELVKHAKTVQVR